MPETSDADLLSSWFHHQSEPAFRALVDRYAGLVYMAAKRTCGDEAMAKEAAQLTFITLSRKAGSLAARESLGGWLHVTAMMQAKNLRQLQKREVLKRERLGTHLESMLPEPPSTLWKNLAPVLDEALASLSKSDREAILLRHYRTLSVREVAASLAISVDAAQKRLDRAMDRLRHQLARRGYATGSSLGVAMMAGLSADAQAGAPLASSFASKALTTGAATGLPALTTFLLTLMTKKIAIVAVVLLAVGVLAVKLASWNSPLQSTAAAASPSSSPPPAGALKPAENPDRPVSTVSEENRRLEAKYGVERTRLSRSVAALAIEVSTKAQLLMDQALPVAAEESGSTAEMGDFGLGLDLNDEQRRKLMSLLFDGMGHSVAFKKESLGRIINNPLPVMEMLLAGDACSRGEVPLKDYEDIRANLGPGLAALEMPVDIESRSMSLGSGLPFEDETFMDRLRAIVDPSQVEAIVGALGGAGPPGAGTAGDPQKFTDFSKMPPLDLTQLEKTVKGTLTIMEGLTEQMEGVPDDLPKEGELGK